MIVTKFDSINNAISEISSMMSNYHLDTNKNAEVLQQTMTETNAELNNFSINLVALKTQHENTFDKYYAN